jgi:predicted RNA-binding protein with PIN domain
MPVEILIDGYNLINNWGILKEKFSRNPESARDFLIDVLHHYKKIKHHSVNVIFDAYNSFSLLPSEFSAKGIKIVFTSMGETADSYIKNKVKHHGEKFIVVSSDNEIKNFANSQGAVSVNSEDFIAKLELAFYMDSKGIQDEEEPNRRLNTKKKGNPKKLPKKLRKNIQKINKL